MTLMMMSLLSERVCKVARPSLRTYIRKLTRSRLLTEDRDSRDRTEVDLYRPAVDDDLMSRLKLVTDIKSREAKFSRQGVKEWAETILVAITVIVWIFYVVMTIQWFMDA
jgi:hypothetical protein